MSDPLEWEDDLRNFEEYELLKGPNGEEIEAEFVEMEGAQHFFYALVAADVLLLAIFVLGVVAIVRM